jgi:hypothetical protein
MSEKSETIGKLVEALSKAQGVMSGAKRESTNPAFRSKYADLASVWDACRKPLADNGLAVIQTLTPSGLDGVTVVTTLAHTSGEWLRSELFIPAAKKDAHGFGSAITYARRFSLAAIVGIAPEDDDGNAVSLPTPPRGPIKAAPTPPEELGEKLGESVDMLSQAVELNSRMANARTIGEVQAAWADVTALQRRGLPRSHVESLRGLKDKRKAELGGSAA